MQSVIISVGTEVEVEAPYSPRFHDAADELGGTLTPDTDVWQFARSDEERVRQLCSEIFSSDNHAARVSSRLPSTAGSSDAAPVSAHQRRANLLDRLDALLDEVVEIHAALRTLNKSA
ncbi:hypothetical protein [Nocardia carnea]|uniref:hypothetical protein n=1 Tax=Nocardia carnea TaxID=37328 RepID=UPI002453FD3C|nr:hypothetical protein [Nocardia carnea]